jgi:hypothetical protein
MGTFFLESRMVVKRARDWVMMVAKTKCHVVRAMGKSGVGVRVRPDYSRGVRTELGRVKNVLVEDNGARTERNPCPAQQSASAMPRAIDCTYAMYTAG